MILFLVCFVCSCSCSTSEKNINQEYTVNKLLDKELPIPSDAKIKDDTLIITGMNPDDIMKEYLKMLSDYGWKQVAVFGTKRYYKKEIDGKIVNISVLSIQEGGLQEKNIDTLIQIRIEKNPDEQIK